MEKTGFFRSIGRMWTHTFDYKGTASLGEYLWPLVFHLILGLLDVMFYFLWWGNNVPEKLGSVLMIALTAYLVLAILPGIALTVRRLHATGRRGAWVFLLLALGIGAAVLLVMCTVETASVAFYPTDNFVEVVYGPPDWEDYDPSENVEPDVYGPPEWFEEDTDLSDEDVTFDPSENEPLEVYGPPEWFEENAQ
ncbi:MAG: DUF805 domain-containing protein [Lachnospiraceae bacterium]|nr:DUF805 domain-containing protein [Lachnospiraceae bacterium]